MAAMMDYSLIWQLTHLCVFERVCARRTKTSEVYLLCSMFVRRGFDLFTNKTNLPSPIFTSVFVCLIYWILFFKCTFSPSRFGRW